MCSVSKGIHFSYIFCSIRANQHAETLQTQYMLLTQQRDELSTKLSAAEDRESKNQAALINLQCALEQFQRGLFREVSFVNENRLKNFLCLLLYVDKDRDVEATTLRIRKHLEDERRAHGDVVTEVRNLQGQLLEAKTGLLAASRISDQLEQSQANLSAQKEECKCNIFCAFFLLLSFACTNSTFKNFYFLLNKNE